MKKTLRRLIPIMLIITTLLSGSVPVRTAEYVAAFTAIGDSIARGTTLANREADCYATLIGDKTGADVGNLGVDGMTSNGLILALQSGAYDAELAKSDAVSISIGSNDLLGPFMTIIEQSLMNSPTAAKIFSAVSQSAFTSVNPADLTALFSNLNTALADNKALNDACDAFGGKLATIVQLLKQKAPGAKLYFNNLYNPYAGVKITNPLTGDIYVDLEAAGEQYIGKFNEGFDPASTDYTLIDLYTPFSKGGLTNANFSLLDFTFASLDPHPTKKGHQTIADTLLKAIDYIAFPADIKDHWATSYIKPLIKAGIFSGIVSTRFNPDALMSRAVFVTVFGRLLGIDPAKPTVSEFGDVNVSSYYTPYISWASKNNIVMGVGGDKFSPDSPILREEMVVILSRAITNLKLTVPAVTTEYKPFTDEAKISDWAKDAVKTIKNAGLITGDETGAYNPQDSITNAEIATILSRLPK